MNLETDRRVDTSGPRRLTRSGDRRIAGVAGGVGDYLGIDPVIVRLGFVLALFAGGAGAVAYLAGWILMPEGNGNRPPGPPRGRPPVDSSMALAAVLLVGAVVIGIASPFDGGVLIPLALIGAGVWLLSQRTVPDIAVPGPADMPASGAPPVDAADTPASTAVMVHEPVPTAPWPVTGTEFPPTEEFRADAIWQGPETTALAPEPRPSAVITRITLSLLALFVAGAIAADELDVVDVSPTAVAALCLIGIGLGAVVAAFAGRGRGRGLIGLGVVAALVLGATAAAEPLIDDGAGERTHRPLSVVDVRDRYELGIGELVVDLRELDIADGETVETTLDLAVGEARLHVPDGVDLEITGDVGIGNLDLLGREQSGFGNELRFDDDTPGTARIVVHIEVGIGDARAVR